MSVDKPLSEMTPYEKGIFRQFVPIIESALREIETMKLANASANKLIGNQAEENAGIIAALLARLALAEKVVEAARKRLKVWNQQTYADINKAISDYDTALAEEKRA